MKPRQKEQVDLTVNSRWELETRDQSPSPHFSEAMQPSLFSAVVQVTHRPHMSMPCGKWPCKPWLYTSTVLMGCWLQVPRIENIPGPGGAMCPRLIHSETNDLIEITSRETLLLFSHSLVPSSLQPHGLQHAGLPCPSPSPGVCSHLCPLSQWCHPAISSSVAPFSSCLQSHLAPGSFPVSWLFASGGQSIGALASVSLATDESF